MKLMIAIAVLLTSINLFADSDSAQKLAQRRFDNMTADEAFDSNKFRTRVWNINMPGTSTWFKPSTSLCINGDTVQTVGPIKVCTLWSAKKDGDVKTFTSKHKAEDYGNNVKCVDSVSKVYSTPINYSYEGCVQWAVKLKDGFPKVKYFNYKSQAMNFAEDSSNAQGNAFCSQEGTIHKTMATTYVMEFYRKVAGINYDDDLYLGEHTYPIASCDQ